MRQQESQAHGEEKQGLQQQILAHQQENVNLSRNLNEVERALRISQENEKKCGNALNEINDKIASLGKHSILAKFLRALIFPITVLFLKPQEESSKKLLNHKLNHHKKYYLALHQSKKLLLAVLVWMVLIYMKQYQQTKKAIKQ